MKEPAGVSRRSFFALSLGLFAEVAPGSGRSEPWRVDRLRIPELERMAERLGCFDLTDWMPRARHLFLAHVMTYGTEEDIDTVKKHFSENDFVEALKNAPIGVFDRYSWAYWNRKFGRDPIPPIPRRGAGRG